MTFVYEHDFINIGKFWINKYVEQKKICFGNT